MANQNRIMIINILDLILWTIRCAVNGYWHKSADDLCDYFKEKQIKHVYVSDLLRTQQTFEHIFPYDIASTTTPLLRERSLGVFEGEYKDEISANPKYEKYFNDPNFKDFRHSFSQKAPEGESYEDVYQRVEHFMNHVVNEDTQKMILSLLHIKLSFVV